jgi:hypothetical protein
MISHLEKYKTAISEYIIKKTEYLELIKNPNLDLSKERCHRKIYHEELLPYSEPKRELRSGLCLSGNPDRELHSMEISPYLKWLEFPLRERDFSWESLFRLIGSGVNYCKMPAKKTIDDPENRQLNMERVQDRTIRIYYLQNDRPIIEEGRIVASPGKDSPKEDFLKWADDWAKMESKLEEKKRRENTLSDMDRMTIEHLAPV